MNSFVGNKSAMHIHNLADGVYFWRLKYWPPISAWLIGDANRNKKVKKYTINI